MFMYSSVFIFKNTLVNLRRKVLCQSFGQAFQLTTFLFNYLVVTYFLVQQILTFLA